MLIMKWSIQPPEYGQTAEEYLHDISSNIPFNIEKSRRTENHNIFSYNPRVFLAASNHQSDQDMYPDLYNLFFRTLTSEGIGYTYNARPFLDIYKPDNAFTSIFSKVMSPQPKDYPRGPHAIYHAYESGPETTLKVLVQFNEYKTYFEKVTNNLYGPTTDYRYKKAFLSFNWLYNTKFQETG